MLTMMIDSERGITVKETKERTSETCIFSTHTHSNTHAEPITARRMCKTKCTRKNLSMWWNENREILLCHVFRSKLNGSLSWRMIPIFPSLAHFSLSYPSSALCLSLIRPVRRNTKNQKFLAKSKEFVGKTLFKLNYKQRIAKKYEKREEERKNDVGAWTNWNQHTTTTETNKNGIIYK